MYIVNIHALVLMQSILSGINNNNMNFKDDLIHVYKMARKGLEYLLPLTVLYSFLWNFSRKKDVRLKLPHTNH